MSRHKKTFAPRVIRYEEQAQDYYEDEKSKKEEITNEDSQVSILDNEVSKIMHKPFRNKAFKKIEDGKSEIGYMSQGMHVQVLSKALNSLGYAVSETEHVILDDAQKAIFQFQSDYGIQEFGVFRTQSLLAIDRAMQEQEIEKNGLEEYNDIAQVEETITEYRGYFEIGKNGKTYFVVVTPFAIEKGDPDQIAEYLFHKQFILEIGSIIVPDEKIWELVDHRVWKNDYFPEIEKKEDEDTSTFRISVDYNLKTKSFSTKGQQDYLAIIKRLYRNTNLLTQWYFDTFNQSLFEGAQPFLRHKIHSTLDELSKFSRAEAFYLKKHIESLPEDFQSNLFYADALLSNFKADKLSYMGNIQMEDGKSMLESYTIKGDPEKEYEALELAKKLDKISPELAKKYIEDKNAFFDYFNQTDNEDSFEKQLNDLGLSVQDIPDFLELFKVKALGKSFNMLRENEALIDSEYQKYTTDKTKLNDVVKAIQGKKKDFKKATEPFGKEFGKILDIFKTQHLGAIGVEESELNELATQVGGAEFGTLIGKMVQMHYAQGDPLALITLNDEGQALFAPRVLLQNMYQFMVAYINFFAQRIEKINAVLRNPDPLLIELEKQKKENSFNPKQFVDQHFSKLAEAHNLFQSTLLDISAYGKETGHIVLRDLTFNFRYLAYLSKKEIKTHILETLKTKKENIQKVRADLNNDPDYVWKLGPLLEFTIQDMGLPYSSTAARLVIDKSGDAFRNDMYVSLTIGAISLVLAVGGLFTGGTTTILGGALFTGSLALGVADIIIEYNRYTSANAANDTSLDPEKELADMDGTSLGLVFAIAGVFLDLLEVIKVVKGLRLANKLTGGLENSAEVLFKTLKSEGKLTDVTLEQFKAQVKQGSKRANELAEAYKMIRDPKFNKVLKLATNDIPLNDIVKTGLYRLYKTDQKLFAQALKTGKLSPDILTRLGIEMVINPHVSGSFAQIATRFGSNPEVFADILRYWGGLGSKHIDDLQYILKVVKTIPDDALTKIILTDYDFIAKIFSGVTTGENLKAILRRWKNWNNPPKGGYKSKTFKEFLGRGNKDVVNFKSLSTFKSKFSHLPTSGAIIDETIKDGTYLVGSFASDLKLIVRQLDYTIINKLDESFPLLEGQKFNILNVSDDIYEEAIKNGGFFTKVNAKWVDSAVENGKDVIVLSKAEELRRPITNDAGEIIGEELTGFGKEIHRFEWVHGYRFNPETKMMVPPQEAKDLKTLTKFDEYKIKN